MRRRLTLLLLFLSLLAGFSGISVYTFFHLIFGPHSGVALTQNEVLERYGDAQPGDEEIPRIIHQVYHNWNASSPFLETLPEDWARVSRSCREVNEGWEYMLWNTSTSLQFLGTHYPWFLPTYASYTHPVQRVDALKYFLLDHHGGVYIDLDNGCSQSLAPLLHLPAFITDGGRGALSNNILGSSPNHSFWKLVTQRLVARNWDWGFPYVTVSEASGQWFLTECWELWFRGQGEGMVRVMMDSGKREEWVFWTSERGGTWERWDNRVFGWVGEHLVMLGAGGGGLVVVLWVLVFRCRRRGGKGGYQSVKSEAV